MTGSPDGPRRVALIAMYGACAAGLLLTLAYWPCQIDDAYITYRYALNFARGAGIAFNAGGPWVEGFTSPAWFVLAALAASVAGKSWLVPIVAFSGLLAFALAVVSAGVVVHRVARVALGEARAVWALAAAVTALVLCPTGNFYALTGLETPLFLLVTLVVLGAASAGLPLLPGMVAGAIASWVRPEAPVLVVVVALVALRHREQARACAWLAVALLVGGAALLLTRQTLFGEWVPNTYYAKQPDVGKGIAYAGALLVTPWFACLSLLAVLGAVFGRGKFLTFALCALPWLAAAALEGGDWMPLGRFAIAASGCLVLAAGGVAGASSRAAQTAAGALAAALTLSSVYVTRDRIRRQHATRRTVFHEAEHLAKWLQLAGARSMASLDIGEVGFLCDQMEIVDLAGLTDRRIARAAGHHLKKRLDTDYVLGERSPDVVVVRTDRPPLMADGKLDPMSVMEQPEFDLVVAPALRERYRLEFNLVPASPRRMHYGMLVFVRNTLVVPQRARPPALVVSVQPLAD